MPELVLHHYPPSPVSEKIRKALGLKSARWISVEENRLPDRPELFAMTGGYRRIPVLQIGADLYCDSQRILRELEHRLPEPTLFPGQSADIAWGIARWIDGALFDSAVRIALAPAAGRLPPELIQDRARLYLGPEADMAHEARDLPHTLSQVRTQLGWLDEQLSGTEPFLGGAFPGLTDVLAWCVYWFIQERYDEAAAFLGEFTHLSGWAGKIDALGHGTVDTMLPEDALMLARESAPADTGSEDALDPQGLRCGMHVGIEPLVDSGERPVTGQIRSIGREELVLTHRHARCGEVAIHFPRVGYRVRPL